MLTTYELRMVEIDIIGGKEKTLYTEPMPEVPRYDKELDHYISDFRVGVYDALSAIERDKKLMERARKLIMFTDSELEEELRRRRDEC